MPPKGSKKRVGDFDDEVAVKKPRTLPKRKPPVKPPSAMNIFGLKCRGAIIAQHPGATIKDVASLINAQWQRLSSSERRRYETEADLMKAALNEDLRKPATKRDVRNVMDRLVSMEKKVDSLIDRLEQASGLK